GGREEFFSCDQAGGAARACRVDHRELRRLCGRRLQRRVEPGRLSPCQGRAHRAARAAHRGKGAARPSRRAARPEQGRPRSGRRDDPRRARPRAPRRSDHSDPAI
ncbi:MAG: hypothetical protein AVDCRST_MAG23-84, partial [uncultured Sphingosinicella sp.]